MLWRMKAACTGERELTSLLIVIHVCSRKAWVEITRSLHGCLMGRIKLGTHACRAFFFLTRALRTVALLCLLLLTYER